jgi:hypothetical protein
LAFWGINGFIFHFDITNGQCILLFWAKAQPFHGQIPTSYVLNHGSYFQLLIQSSLMSGHPGLRVYTWPYARRILQIKDLGKREIRDPIPGDPQLGL